MYRTRRSVSIPTTIQSVKAYRDLITPTRNYQVVVPGCQFPRETESCFFRIVEVVEGVRILSFGRQPVKSGSDVVTQVVIYLCCGRRRATFLKILKNMWLAGGGICRKVLMIFVLVFDLCGLGGLYGLFGLCGLRGL